jgi:hypothetical protein
VFEGLINEAEAAAGAVVSKYAARASVVVPFLFALTFATLAITFLLMDRYGAISAFTIVALAYGTVGLLAAISVANVERGKTEQRVAVQDAAAATATSKVAQTVMAEAPLALAVSLLSSVGGPTAALNATRALARNWPLVVLAGLIGILIFSNGETEPEPVDEKVEPNKLNGVHPNRGGASAPTEQASL